MKLRVAYKVFREENYRAWANFPQVHSILTRKRAETRVMKRIHTNARRDLKRIHELEGVWFEALLRADMLIATYGGVPKDTGYLISGATAAVKIFNIGATDE